MKTTELADALAHMAKHFPVNDDEAIALVESSLALHRLAAIEAAVPGEVREIAIRDGVCRGQIKCDDYGEVARKGEFPSTVFPTAPWGMFDAIADRGALLAIVAKQQEQIQALAEGVRLYRLYAHSAAAAASYLGADINRMESRALVVAWETKDGRLADKEESI